MLWNRWGKTLEDIWFSGGNWESFSILRSPIGKNKTAQMSPAGLFKWEHEIAYKRSYSWKDSRLLVKNSHVSSVFRNQADLNQINYMIFWLISQITIVYASIWRENSVITSMRLHYCGIFIKTYYKNGFRREFCFIFHIYWQWHFFLHPVHPDCISWSAFPLKIMNFVTWINNNNGKENVDRKCQI